MKAIILSIFLVVLTSKRVVACDICGGVGSNVSIGILAATKFHTIGFKSTYRHFSSYLFGIQHSNESIFLQELRFRAQLNKRFQLLGSIPYQFSFQSHDTGSESINGFGDPNLLLNGILLHKKDTNGLDQHFLTLGFGLKFPLGKNVTSSSNLKNLYPGTGSLDYLVISTYTHQFTSKFGWQTELSYSLKGTDKYAFKYGNSTQLNTQLYYSKKLKEYRLIFALGAVFDHFESTSIEGKIDPVIDWKGQVLALKSSLNLFTYNWLWTVSVQQPVQQSSRNGSVLQHTSASVSLNYLIKNNKK